MNATTVMPTVSPGRVLASRYELVSTLGTGGMATVFLARDRVLNRDVAVKVLLDQFATDPAFLARFTREALDAARLSHPGLVTIFDAGVDQEAAFIVMELVHGRTLLDVLDTEGPLPILRAVSIAADVCAALDAAHQAGIVHRDIKPGNILLSDDGRTRVFDFGIARTSGSAQLTEVSTVIGTAAYLAPEQAAGAQAGRWSDLYAVGCVLDEMLTGSPPFTAATPVALLHRHVHDQPAPPSARRPEVGGRLDAVVLHLLAKDPADRPASAAEARRELLAALDPSPNATLITPAISVVGASVRWRSAAAVVVVVACVVAVGLGLALGLGRQAGAPANPAGSPTAALTAPTPDSSATTRPGSTAPPIAVPVATTTAAGLAAVREVIAAGQSAGLIDPSAAARLITATDDVARTVDKAKGKSSVPQVQGLDTLVDALVASGEVEPAAAASLHTAISQLLRLVEQEN